MGAAPDAVAARFVDNGDRSVGSCSVRSGYDVVRGFPRDRRFQVRSSRIAGGIVAVELISGLDLATPARLGADVASRVDSADVPARVEVELHGLTRAGR